MKSKVESTNRSGLLRSINCLGPGGWDRCWSVKADFSHPDSSKLPAGLTLWSVTDLSVELPEAVPAPFQWGRERIVLR